MPSPRPLALAAALSVLLLSAPAAARTVSPAACTHLAQRLAHYDAMRVRAAQSGNPLWLARLNTIIASNEEQFAERCPDEAAAVASCARLADLLRLAGRGALSFLTLGAF